MVDEYRNKFEMNLLTRHHFVQIKAIKNHCTKFGVN